MNAKLIHGAAGAKVFAVILDPGEHAMACLKDFVRREGITAAQVTGIGAFESAELAFWKTDEQDYARREVGEQTEVLSLLGDVVANEDGEPTPHLHAVLGLRDMTCLGGHFIEGVVRPTLELLVTETPAHLRRRFDKRLGLATIAP